MKSKLVQIQNPKTGYYIKIRRFNNSIISCKKTKGAYKNIRIIEKYKIESEFVELLPGIELGYKFSYPFFTIL